MCALCARDVHAKTIALTACFRVDASDLAQMHVRVCNLNVGSNHLIVKLCESWPQFLKRENCIKLRRNGCGRFAAAYPAVGPSSSLARNLLW